MTKLHKISYSIHISAVHSFIGFEKIVQMLIEKGADVNAVNEDNFSAIIYAANRGNNVQFAFDTR